jgi:hypothetical protein
MRGRTWATLASAALLLSMTACVGEDNTPVCRPATVASCYCATGAFGQKICADDGLEYTRCECLPASTSDAAPDAGALDAAASGDPSQAR